MIKKEDIKIVETFGDGRYRYELTLCRRFSTDTVETVHGKTEEEINEIKQKAQKMLKKEFLRRFIYGETIRDLYELRNDMMAYIDPIVYPEMVHKIHNIIDKMENCLSDGVDNEKAQ